MHVQQNNIYVAIRYVKYCNPLRCFLTEIFFLCEVFLLASYYLYVINSIVLKML